MKGGLTVLVSSSYLAEAEACECVLVLNGGIKLAEGPPASVASLARGRTFLAQPPEGTKPRDFQARLLDEPNIVDAVPENGQVRLITEATPPNPGPARSLALRLSRRLPGSRMDSWCFWNKL